MDIKYGNVVVVEETSRSGPRLIGVVTGIKEGMFVHIHLLSNETENATDFDIVMTSAESGLPFSLLLEAEIYGWVPADQVIGVLGDLDQDLVSDLTRSLVTDGESVEKYRHGIPLGGPGDPRRRFKRDELARLQRYTVGDVEVLASGT